MQEHTSTVHLEFDDVENHCIFMLPMLKNDSFETVFVSCRNLVFSVPYFCRMVVLQVCFFPHNFNEIKTNYALNSSKYSIQSCC